MRSMLLAGIAGALTFVSPASAAVTLLATGSLTGSSAGTGVDLSPFTETLENGLPQNILGGIGSGLTYAGGNTFLAVPDRGPNATPYASSVDDTVSYINRFQTLSMSLTKSTSGSLPYTLTPTLAATTLLYSTTALNYGTGAGLTTNAGTTLGSGAPVENKAGVYYFTGRSDNYGSGTSANAADARFDPESIRVSNDGRSVFISDEYGPYIRQFDRATGALIKTFELPDNLAVSKKSPNGAVEISDNATGRIANKGMEGLAITPDGKTLVGILQAATEQDSKDPATANMLRIVTVDIASGKTQEFGYMLTNGSGVSDITAINDHEFLVDERDGKGLGDGSKAKVKQMFTIDTTGAKDITGLLGSAAAADVVTKSSAPFLDLVSALKGAGYTADQIPAKIEGISFGEDVTVDGTLMHTLYVANDNDFVPATAGANQFFVFGFQDGDLPGFVPQTISAVPETSTWAMMIAGVGFVGFSLRRRRSTLLPA